MDQFNTRQHGKLGLSINTLMREVLIGQGLSYDHACRAVDAFGRAFDALTGTEWLEVNGTTEWHLTFDGREQPMSEDQRKRLGLSTTCPCGRKHPTHRDPGDKEP